MRAIPSRTTRADLVAALNVIQSLPQAYYSQGPDTVIREIRATVEAVFSGQYAGLGKPR